MTETIVTSIAVLLRIFSNPFGNVFQKQLTEEGRNPLFVNFFTYLLLSIICVPFAININWSMFDEQFWLFSVLGGLAGAAGNGFLVKALQKGELSILGPINSYKSVVGIIGGIILLGEFPNLWGMFGICLIIYGSYFVLDTTKEKFSFALLKRSDIQFRFFAMILTAIEAVFIKRVIVSSSPSVAFLCWCFFGAIFSFAIIFLFSLDVKKEVRILSIRDLRKYIFLILCIGVMQFSTNYAFAHMQVGYALSLFQLSIIISVFLGHRIFKEKDVAKKLIGSVIMILGSILIILLK